MPKVELRAPAAVVMSAWEAPNDCAERPDVHEEPGEFCGGEIHELMDCGHVVAAAVGGEAGLADHGASQQDTEVADEMAEEDIAVGAWGTGRGWVGLELSRGAVVKPVDCFGLAVHVGRGDFSGEVFGQVDLLAVDGAG